MTQLGVLAVLGVVGAVVGISMLRSVTIAALVLLGAMLFRLALPHLVVADPFVLAYAGLVAAMALWLWRNRGRRARLGAVEVAMGLFILWSFGSMVLPHDYPAVEYPLDGTEVQIPRFILISTIIPFTMYIVGRLAFERESQVRLALWAIVAFCAYSALVSILQFYAPSLVWPRYIVTHPNWVGRANGVLNQPVGNGIVLTVGFVAALALASDHREPRWRRAALYVLTLATSYAIYLTHTRAALLSFALILVLGAVLAPQFRRACTIYLVGGLLLVITNWDTFTSADRDAGGVESPNEIWDRLNLAATSFWAFGEKPWLGWGIGRFMAVNIFHHKQWSNDIPWVRGYGIASHFNELGILVELGLLGLALWLGVILPIGARLVRAYQSLPAEGLVGKRLALVALAAYVTQIIAGTSADLRLLDFPSAMVFLLGGLAIGAGERARAQARPPTVVWKSDMPPAMPTASERTALVPERVS